jgi:hypothetical protein
MADPQVMRVENFEFDLAALRQAFLQPSVVRSFQPIEIVPQNELTAYYYEMLDDAAVTISHGDAHAIPRSEFGTSRASISIPHVASQLAYTRQDLDRLSGDKLPFGDRETRLGQHFSVWEDAMCIIGKADLGILGASTTNGTTHTNASTQLDLTTQVTALTTMQGLIDQLISGLGGAAVRANPMVLEVTNDVMSRLNSGISTNTDKVLKDYLLEMMQTYGTAQIVQSDYLGGSFTYADNRVTVTNGTTNAMLHLINPMYAKLLTSNLYSNSDSSPRTGIVTDWELKSVVAYRDPLARIYSGTVDVTA